MFDIGMYDIRSFEDVRQFADDVQRFSRQIKSALYLEGSVQPKRPIGGGVLFVQDGNLKFDNGSSIIELGETAEIEAEPQGLSTVPMLPASGLVLGNQLTATLTTQASANNRMTISPFRSEFDLTVDGLGISVSAFVAGNASVLVFDADENGRPTAILAQSPNINTGSNATTIATLSSNFTFQKNKRYWLGVWTSSNPTLRCGQPYTNMPITWTTAATPVRQSALIRTLTYGTADDWVYSSGQHSSINAFLILLRVA